MEDALLCQHHILKAGYGLVIKREPTLFHYKDILRVCDNKNAQSHTKRKPIHVHLEWSEILRGNEKNKVVIEN